jgi:hypothetical protein
MVRKEKIHDKTKLGVTIARKVLPHPQGIKGSMQNLLNMGAAYMIILMY